jgi:hypothetical protein
MSNTEMAQEEPLNEQATVSAPSAAPRYQSHKIIVPNTMPYMQMKDVAVWKQEEEIFDSVHDFIATFEKTLRANDLDLDTNWGKLLPLCLDQEQTLWLGAKRR